MSTGLRRVVLVVLWVASLLVAAEWGLRAQQNPQGAILSGSDLGFRVDGQFNGKPFGALVLRVNGQWVEIGGSVHTMPTHQ